MKRTLFYVVALVALVSPVASAEITMPPIFGDNMVLQQNGARVFGTAAPGTSVTVEMKASTDGKAAACSAATSVGKDGKWCVEVKTPKSAGMTWTVTVKENKTLAKTFKNVLLGEVWICSGQSNMGFSLSQSAGGKGAITDSADDQLRLIQIPQESKDDPQTTHGGSWAAASPETTSKFSAVGYYFGRELRKRYKCPIGLIKSAWGGSRCEAWISKEGLIQGGFEESYIIRYEAVLDKIKAFTKQKADYRAKLADYDKREKEGKLKEGERKPGPPRGKRPKGGFGANHQPTRLYNGMIHPLVPLKVAGAIWYQGEANTQSMGNAKQYATLFPALINDWRRVFKNDKMKFLWVQLANFRGGQRAPAEAGNSWAELQFSQTATLKLPLTGQAVINDLGEGKNIHPRKKLDVGKRLAAVEARLAKDPNCKHRTSGPMLKECTLKGSKAALEFYAAGDALAIRGDGDLKGFGVCDKDGKWHWATAKITGKLTIELTAPAGVTITRVCYNWGGNPRGNLVDGAGHPAGLFRSELEK
ncbi:MAG: hypothetical protein HN370_07135 [Phycisphaerales bacterium]|nr:hypothetical protein [Phycisphaerales bacterium]